MATNLPPITKVVLRIPDATGVFSPVEIDCCVTESHTLTNTLTDHPVEQGSNITDHSRPEPRRVTLEIVQSNTPPSGADGTDRVRRLWDLLVGLHENPKLVSVDTVRDNYTSMGIESITSNVDAKTAQILKVTVALKEVIIVSNSFSRVVLAPPTAQPKKDAGKTTTTVVNIDQSTSAVKSAFGKAVN